MPHGAVYFSLRQRPVLNIATLSHRIMRKVRYYPFGAVFSTLASLSCLTRRVVGINIANTPITRASRFNAVTLADISHPLRRSRVNSGAKIIDLIPHALIL